MPFDRRLHPWSFVFELGAHAKALLVPGLIALFAAGTGGSGWEVWAMLLIIPYAGAAIGRALSVRYRFGASELVIRTGLIFRRERHIPYDRIQNIDAVQNVVHRTLDVMSIRIETGGGTEAEAQLNVLSTEAFLEMRHRIFAGRDHPAAQPDSGVPREDAPVPLLHLPAREIALWGLIRGQGLVVVGALFGVALEMGLFDRLATPIFGEQGAGRGVLRRLAAAVFGGGALPARELLVMAAAFILLLIAIRLFSVGLALVRFHGFLLTRAGDDLRSEFGALTRVSASVPVYRIQSLTVHESPLHRLFGRASISVETAGGEADQNLREQREWLVPIVRASELGSLLRRILPIVDLAEVTWHSVHPRAVRRALIGPLIMALTASIGLAVLLRGGALAALAVLTLLAWMDARKFVATLGWSLTGQAIAFRSGWLWRRVTIAPLAKVQAVSLSESPFDRRSGMANVSVDTAGAADAAHRLRIPYLPRESARMLHEQLTAAASRTTFRW